MSDTILSGRWSVFYLAENRQKRLVRNTSTSPTTIDTVNQVYSAAMDLFDELAQMDDGTVMSAQTPTEYTIGIIDAGDKDPWFIDRTSVEYLKGGALKTASWARSVGTNTGIVRVNYTVGGTDFDATDIGRAIKDTTNLDVGTLLDFNTVSSTKQAWIRPNSNAAGDSFNAAAANTLAIQQASLSQVFRSTAADSRTDVTTAANDATANDWQFFPTGAGNGDYAAIGFVQPFKKLTVNVGTAGAGTYTVPNWQYWNGAWTNLTGVTDGTNGFKTVGTNNVTFTVPSDWTATSLSGSASLYYVRAARDGGTVTTDPLGTQGWIGGTGSVTKSAVAADTKTGESLWSNIYSLGTIESATHLYVSQDNAFLTKYKSLTSDWWGDGHIDILVNVKEVDVTAGTNRDKGYLTVFGRQYTKTYDNYLADVRSGGRNPIPLAAGADLNNTTGFRQFTGSSGNGTFVAGYGIYVGTSWAAATARGVVTLVAGTGAAPILDYYLIGDLTDFSNGNAVKAYNITTSTDLSGTVNCTAGTPADVGPATYSTITQTFGADSTRDIDENSTNENYSIVINLASTYTVKQGYERTKYVTRYGGTADIDAGAQTVNGQFYIGTEYRLQATGAITGTFTLGEKVTQATSNASGYLTAVNTGSSPKLLILRDTLGTFNTTNVVTGSSSGATVTPDSAATALAPIKAAPFGTFAGTTWFTSPGVVLSNYLSTDANNFQLTDDNGNVIKAPTKINITVTNLTTGDRIAVFRLTGSGGTIVKNRYNATAQAAGVTSITVGSSISADEPGKAAGGVIRLVDLSANQEYRLRFSSWTGTSFTLASSTGLTADAGTNSTTIVDSGVFTNARVGDLIRATSPAGISYITTVTDNNTVSISPAITGLTTGSTYEINTLPVATTTTPQDTWYVPFIDTYQRAADGTTTAATITHLSTDPDIYIKVRVRQSNAAGTKIIPFETDDVVQGANSKSLAAIRATDTIIT